MKDLAELKEPIEVWKAIEGEPADLIALLRSEEPLRRWERDTLADWLEGKLQPVSLPKGRPDLSVTGPTPLLYKGHNIHTRMGSAAIIEMFNWEFIRKKGWHLKRSGKFYWSRDRLREKIAERWGIETEAFFNYLKRSRSARPKAVSGRDYIEFRRRRLAYQIRRAKIGDKD